MWKPCLDVIAPRAKGAIHILGRFCLVAHMSKAIDEVRADEAKATGRDGYEPILKPSHWCLLKRPENLTAQQSTKHRHPALRASAARSPKTVTA